MSKNRLLIASISFLLAGGILAFYASLHLSRRSNVSLEDLLLDSHSFPSSWHTGLEAVSVEWETWKAQSSLEPKYAFYSKSNLGRVWGNSSDKDDFPAQYIAQHLFYYNSPFAAARQHLLSRPEIVYGDDWPNFQLSHNKQNRYPLHWQYESPFADQEHVVCAMGSPNSCQLWFYWARYGQYVLEVRFFAANQGMNAELFTQIVVQIDSAVGKGLE
jgi:hypothetical protein